MSEQGAIKICPICKKKHLVTWVEKYAYQRREHLLHTTVTHYFCSWSCMRKWDAMQPQQEVRFDY